MSESMGTTATIRLVAGREISTRLRSKAFRVTTVITLLVIVGALVAFKLIGGGGGDQVGFTPSAQPLAVPLESVARAVGHTVKTSTVEREAGERKVREGDLDALVTGTPDGFQVIVKQDISPKSRAAFSVLVRQLTLNKEIAKAGGNPATVAAAVDAATVDVRGLEPARDHQDARMVLAIIVGILVYIAIMLYGQLVAQGVVEEKASRIVEILLTTIRPWQLMMGKVLGIGLVGLVQLTLISMVGVGSGLAMDAFTFPTAIATSAAVWSVLWFLLGYLVYAFLLAALGALVSRQEDVGAATAPALTAIMLPYVLAVSILPGDPDNPIMAIASLIPFFSPMIMPMRIALDVAPTWEIALSVGLTVALFGGLVFFAGRVYHNAVLRMGARVTLMDALRAPR